MIGSTFRKPPRLQPGDQIAVVAPASPLKDGRLEAGLRYLRDKGFRLVLGEHLYDEFGYLAGPDAARAGDLQEAFSREDVKAVFCARGGYGSIRIVDDVDWSVLRERPKVFVGYSDITTLHLAIHHSARLVTFHGPMVVNLGEGLNSRAERTFWHAVTSPEPLEELVAREDDVQTVVPGQASGVLAGGNLSLVCASLGAAEAPDFAGCIVVLEDTDEPLYRVDRLLTQLVRSGCCDEAAGFAFGTVTNLDREERQWQLDELIADILGPLNKPILMGLPIGHVDNPLTIPFGCRALLDATSRSLVVMDGAVT